MAIEPPYPIILLGSVSDEEDVSGISVTPLVLLGVVPDLTQDVYGISRSGVQVWANIGEIADEDDVSGVQIFTVPTPNFRRVQLDGGGRIVLNAVLDDDAVIHYFELWKDARRHRLEGLPLPIFRYYRPSGGFIEKVSSLVNAVKARISVIPPKPDEVGTWPIQVRFVEALAGIDQRWRRRPTPLYWRVREDTVQQQGATLGRDIGVSA